MRRRDILALAGALAIGTGGEAPARPASKPYRIATLRSGAADEQTQRLKRRLAELDYLEGRDFVLEIRSHRGHIERLPELAAEIVRDRPAVIIASGPEAVLKAVSSATVTIPIVFLAIDYDPV